MLARSSFLGLISLALAAAKTVTVSNVQLPNDINGDPLLTGECSIVFDKGLYYFYVSLRVLLNLAPTDSALIISNDIRHLLKAKFSQLRCDRASTNVLRAVD
jgi:hypothetical protein